MWFPGENLNCSAIDQRRCRRKVHSSEGVNSPAKMRSERGSEFAWTRRPKVHAHCDLVNLRASCGATIISWKRLPDPLVSLTAEARFRYRMHSKFPTKVPPPTFRPRPRRAGVINQVTKTPEPLSDRRSHRSPAGTTTPNSAPLAMCKSCDC